MTNYSVATLAELKTALANSAANNQADIITLTADLSATSGMDFTNGTGGNNLLKIAVTDGMTLSIVGGGHTLDANSFGRALEVSSGTVLISDLTVREGALAANGGDPEQAGGSALGAGIYNSGNLTLTNVTVTANAASGGGGSGGVSGSTYAGGGGGGGGLGTVAGAGGAGLGSGYSLYSGSPGSAGQGGDGGPGVSGYGSLSGRGGGVSGGAGGSYFGQGFGGAGGTATIGGLSLGGGGGGAGMGGPAKSGGAAVGGIYNSGTLVLSGGAVTGNLAAGGGGGGTHVNPAAAGGAAVGGVQSTGTLTLVNASITGNAASGGLGGHANVSSPGGPVGATGSATDDRSGVANHAPTGAVSIAGSTNQGQTLTASHTLADADGLGTISYQWKSDGVNIGGATTSTFVLTQAQVSHVVTVTASYTDGASFAQSSTSAGTSAIANLNDTPTGAVSITGTATQGQTLTAGHTLVDPDGLGTISYQWKSDGVAISGATSSTFVLTQVQVGHVVTVVASYTDGGTTAESMSSAGTSSVANLNDAPTGLPTLSGSTVAGQVLTAATGAIADADGLGAFSYVWKAGGVVIGGATAVTYTLTSAEVGKLITVTASYTDLGGAAESLTSTASAAVTAAPTPPAPEPEPSVVTGGTVDGAAVSTTTTTASDGSQVHTVVVAPLAPGRVDSGGGASTADIPLVIVNGANLVTIGLPTGTGFSASGPTAPASAGAASTFLTAAINAAASGQQMAGGVNAFLQTQPTSSILVQTITLTGAQSGAPLAISGLAPGSGATTALVIDTHNLSGQTLLTLDNIDFAAVIGEVRITGGAGAQTVYADNARQYMVLGADDDALHGGGGNDTVGSAEGSDSIFGDDGNDDVFGGLGNDVVNGGADNDVVQGNQGDDFVQGNAGNDLVYGGQGDDIVHGGQGDDQLWGDLGQDRAFGGLGNDTLNGGDANDVLWGGGDPSLADAGADLLRGEAGDDVLQGNKGTDTLDGGAGADLLLGGQGGDSLLGADGDDRLSGDLGNDTLSGGAGADTFLYAMGHGADRLIDFRQGEGDHIQFHGPHGAYTTAQVGADTIVDFGGGDSIVLVNVQLASLASGWIVG